MHRQRSGYASWGGGRRKSYDNERRSIGIRNVISGCVSGYTVSRSKLGAGAFPENKRAFLWTYEYQGQMRINVKADPEWIDFWRKAYEAVIPGYHQNKKHWNTVILDGSVPDGEVKRMIAESYDLVR